MTNKEIAKTFLQMAAKGDVKTAYERFIAPQFIHHNQYFKGDRESLMIGMIEASKTTPNKSIVIMQSIAEGDLVMTLSHVVREDPQAAGIAVVHIFKFRDQKVVELWDLGQQIIPNSPNTHGAF